jgi:hypothetical protein
MTPAELCIMHGAVNLTQGAILTVHCFTATAVACSRFRRRNSFRPRLRRRAGKTPKNPRLLRAQGPAKGGERRCQVMTSAAVTPEIQLGNRAASAVHQS